MRGRVLTVADIVGAHSLDISVLAGGLGQMREILWAHSCEMADPVEWLGPHELLMTVGLCVPKLAGEQVEFVARLDEAGLAGMVIGDHDVAPKLTGRMLAEADRRQFPILLAGRRTSYAVVARHVAAANTTDQTLQVLALSKLYHLAASADGNATSLVADLAAQLNIGIDVLDQITGLSLLSSAKPEGSLDGIRDVVRSYPLEGRHRAQVVLSEFPGEPLDSFLLVHLLQVLRSAVDRLLDAADRRSEVMARLMHAVLNGTADARALRTFLSPHELSEGFHLVAVSKAVGPHMARASACLQLSVLVGPGRVHDLALVPADELGSFRGAMDDLVTTAGISSVFTDIADARAAAVEAGKVLTSTEEAKGWAAYEGSSVSVLTRSKKEADDIVSRVLGPLAGDDERSSSLRATLFAYLRNDRRWQDTADELQIHRQTLSYRLKRVQELTGLDLRRSSDLSAAWVAFQAWRLTGGS
ncbi:purine catabolism regulatory protein [Klenkia brasiliensis]|jgi:purine catabolism regulator|uniref:Purine catabolism regulatory protein n=1 Tax=Klenkia brasiliensis TaxID=333142 RepID=A0A1G7SDI4_9ACTN|nr:purine catabolism regulatory protein [Klenkia brasiliensis]